VPSSFSVYIDESGCDGFRFGAGSSDWLVLSAVVVRTCNDHKLIHSLRESRTLLGRQAKQALHFVKLQHPQRVAWAQTIATLPVRTVSVLVHKPSISEPETFIETKYLLYRYCSRLLMERVSWFCRDHHDQSKGDGTANIYFSNRARMSYSEIRDYWQRLKEQNDQKNVRIVWAHIDPMKIAAMNHDQLAGLQLADCVAASHWQAVSFDKYGNSESKYFSEMKPALYRRERKAIGYGLKFWPDLQKLRPSLPHLTIFDGL
jgi:hypothetical protein